MNSVFFHIPALMAAPETAGAAGAQGGGAGSLITTFITFGLVILVFYFLMIRPQNKKQKEAQKMLDNLKKGDKVVTIGGIRGNVISVKEQTVVVKVDENVKIEFSKSAIASVLESKERDEKEEQEDEKKKDKKASKKEALKIEEKEEPNEENDNETM